MKSMRVMLVMLLAFVVLGAVAVAGPSPVLIPKVPYAFALQMPTPTIDGDLKDWAAAGALALPVVFDKVHMDNLPLWKGVDDLSGKCYIGWNADGFYFAAEIKDDVQRNPMTDSNMWQGDSIQFSIDGALTRSYSYDSDDYEYGVALTPAGPQVTRWKAASGKAGGLVADAKAAVVRDEAKKVTYYEMALPLSEIAPAVPAGGAVVGFSILINEDDGTGRAGWAEWTGGIGASKDPSLYGELVFLEVKQ